MRVIIDSDNGSSPVRRQAITSTNADLMSLRLLETNFDEIRIKLQNFSLLNMYLNMSSVK